MKSLIKKLLKFPADLLMQELNLRRLRASRLYRELFQREPNRIDDLRLQYSTLLHQPDKRVRLRLHERRIFSQGGEDGLLLHFLAGLGAPNKTFIEFGIEDGTECNAASLAIYFGWTGLFIEGSPSLAERARAFYHERHGLDAQRVKIVSQFITRENVNQVFAEHGFRGEVDLLSLDIDGNDYWIWQAIDVVSPRLVVIEYNASFGPDRSITVPYDPSFDRYQKHPSGWYHGASLTALAKLAQAKGYKLTGCDSFGANAFFVRQDLVGVGIEEFSVAEAYYPSVPRLREQGVVEQFQRIKHLPYVEV